MRNPETGEKLLFEFAGLGTNELFRPANLSQINISFAIRLLRFLIGKPLSAGPSPRSCPHVVVMVSRLRALFVFVFVCASSLAMAAEQKSAEVCPRAEAGSTVVSPRDLRSQNGKLTVSLALR